MRPVIGPALLIAALATHAQQPTSDFTDPAALLKAVAKNYAKGADTFRMEAISETTANADLRHEWRKVYQTAIKGPRNLYRIETRSAFGSMIQDSDGTNEWVYSIEGNMYVKRPCAGELAPVFKTPLHGKQRGDGSVADAHDSRIDRRWL